LEFFQDDIFPPTRVVEPLVSAEEFYSMAEQKQPSYVSLKPADMTPLSEGKHRDDGVVFIHVSLTVSPSCLDDSS